MLPLRYARRWQLAGLLALIGVLIAALAPATWFMPQFHGTRLIPADKALHALTFVFLTVWFSGQYAARAYWRVATAMLGFGAAIEICQGVLGYRDAETMDLVADAAGIAIGLAIAFAGAGGWSLRLENWLQLRQSP